MEGGDALKRLLAAMQQGVSAVQAVGGAYRKDSVQVAPDLSIVPIPAGKERHGKGGAIHYLMEMVDARFGIHASASVEKKLQRIFGGVPRKSLCEWVDELAALPSSHAEWLSLVENLTVHETYFYRDKPMMNMLATDILPKLVAQKRIKQDYAINCWSAGCSTGEEVFQLSMLVLQALLDANEAGDAGEGAIRPHPRWTIRILGTDVSRQVLRTARNGIYADFGMGSFRDMPESMLRFFEPISDVAGQLPGANYFRVQPCLAKHAVFRQHNLLSGEAPDTGFDLVMCRNVMIYFQDDNKRRAQETLYDALAQGGVLILGGTDVQCLPERYYAQSGAGGAWYVKN